VADAVVVALRFRLKSWCVGGWRKHAPPLATCACALLLAALLSNIFLTAAVIKGQGGVQASRRRRANAPSLLPNRGQRQRCSGGSGGFPWHCRPAKGRARRVLVDFVRCTHPLWDDRVRLGVVIFPWLCFKLPAFPLSLFFFSRSPFSLGVGVDEVALALVQP
jgi:hypothetical protein